MGREMESLRNDDPKTSIKDIVYVVAYHNRNLFLNFFLETRNLKSRIGQLAHSRDCFWKKPITCPFLIFGELMRVLGFEMLSPISAPPSHSVHCVSLCLPLIIRVLAFGLKVHPLPTMMSS